MRRIIVHAALMAGGALMLAGCGLADSRSPVPEFMRAKASDSPPPEPPPDVGQLVRKNLESVFVANSYPRQVRVSPPHRDLHGGLGWTACVRAELTSAMGKPLGPQTLSRHNQRRRDRRPATRRSRRYLRLRKLRADLATRSRNSVGGTTQF